MIKGLAYTLSLLLMLAFSAPKNDWIQGKWHIDFMVQNGDTIYKYNDFQYTYRYHYKLNATYKDVVDSASILKNAQINFDNSNKIYWNFQKTFFTAAALRSGGRGNLDEIDSGKYSINKDSVFTTNHSRNMHKTLIRINAAKKTLYIKDSFQFFQVFIQFRKSK